MNFEKGELLYSVGTANAGRATVVASMAIHTQSSITSQLSLARDMQSEHMTRVRKRVAQNKFGPQARQEVDLENKVLGAYTGLAQKPRIHKLAIADGEPGRKHRTPHARNNSYRGFDLHS